jgi:hypothetical protein
LDAPTDAGLAAPTNCAAGAQVGGGGGVAITVTGLWNKGMWVAWQDGDSGPWQLLASDGGNSTATFTPQSGRYAVAAACGDSSSWKTQVHYRTTATTQLPACNESSGCANGLGLAVTGTLSGVGTDQWLRVNRSGDIAINPTGGVATYSLSDFPFHDMVFAVGPANKQFSQIAVLRGALAAAFDAGAGMGDAGPATVDVNFATQGKAAIQKTFSMTGLAPGDSQSHFVSWQLGPGLYGCGTTIELEANSQSASDSYASLDPSLVQSGDLYNLTANANHPGDGGVENDVDVNGTFHTAANITIPISYFSAMLSWAGSSPYGRVRADFAQYPGATLYTIQSYSRPDGGVESDWYVDATPDWLAACTSYWFAAPDLSGVTGWNPAWGLAPGVPAFARVTATADNVPLSDGTMSVAANYATTVTP